MLKLLDSCRDCLSEWALFALFFVCIYHFFVGLQEKLTVYIMCIVRIFPELCLNKFCYKLQFWLGCSWHDCFCPWL